MFTSTTPKLFQVGTRNCKSQLDRQIQNKTFIQFGCRFLCAAFFYHDDCAQTLLAIQLNVTSLGHYVLDLNHGFIFWPKSPFGGAIIDNSQFSKFICAVQFPEISTISRHLFKRFFFNSLILAFSVFLVATATTLRLIFEYTICNTFEVRIYCSVAGHLYFGT